jgi:heme/copper-type cytochrome/quinol oxidase subunit 2
MDKKQMIAMTVAIVFLVAIIFFFILNKGGLPVQNAPRVASTAPNNTSTASIIPGIDKFSPVIPQGATLTPPKAEAPASANPSLDTKIRTFNLKATRDGFVPKSITVNSGDTVVVDFTAADGDYDLDIPYLGAYFKMVKQGTMTHLPFDTNLAGTFNFLCRDFCPAGKVIQGQLIVLPKK